MSKRKDRAGSSGGQRDASRKKSLIELFEQEIGPMGEAFAEAAGAKTFTLICGGRASKRFEIRFQGWLLAKSEEHAEDSSPKEVVRDLMRLYVASTGRFIGEHVHASFRDADCEDLGFLYRDVKYFESLDEVFLWLPKGRTARNLFGQVADAALQMSDLQANFWIQVARDGLDATMKRNSIPRRGH